MKKTIFRMTGMLVLAIMAIAQVARAQQPVLANIPFEFTVGKKVLPAGEYSVARMSMNTRVLLIQRTDRSAQMIVISNATMGKEPQLHSNLVFHKYGNRYFLAQVWSAGSSYGRQLLKSPAEKELALSAHMATPDKVTLVALISPKQ